MGNDTGCDMGPLMEIHGHDSGMGNFVQQYHKFNIIVQPKI